MPRKAGGESLKNHNRGRRVDGTLRPSAQRHREKVTAKRPQYGGSHTKKSRLERPFWGIDGEGAGQSRDHDLAIVRSGVRVLRAGPLTGDAVGTLAAANRVASLDFPLVMAFLQSSIPDDVEAVCYGLDYHVAMWCKSLPAEKLAELVDREGRTDPKRPFAPRPVTAHGYAFDWLPAHNFWCRGPSGRSIRISEVRRFFGRDLPDALKSEGLNVFEPEDPDERLEWRVAVLEALMTVFRERCVGVNVVPAHWEGPGQGATVLMQRWGIKDHLSGAYRP